MDYKDGKFNVIIKNVAAAIVLLIIGLIVLMLGLRHYTKHGVEVVVPDVRGMWMDEANQLLADSGLTLTIIDSTYSVKTPLGTIVEQNPEPGSHAKPGREVYVIQNARFRRPVVIPELRDMSLRQAQTTLRTLGIEVSDIQYEPSTYKNLILDVKQGENCVNAGDRLQEGDQVLLIVGMGKGTEKTDVPMLTGKTLLETRSWLLSKMLTIGSVSYDLEPTTENKELYVVYEQSPEPGEVVLEGTAIDLKMTLDIEKTVTSSSQNDDENFF